MSFMEPLLLAAMPLVALPIIIHLINQRRFQTIRWGAMMFLLAANRLSRGYARLRQWLIMAFRMLAVAALIFAIARPLASGWLGLTAGGRPDTTIILVDRSPSMRQSHAGGGGSKLETGLRKLAETLKTIGSGRWVLVDSLTNQARDIASPDDLLDSPSTAPASSSADVTALLQSAYDYIKTNKTGRTDVWICSDVRENDWNPDSSRWETLRDAFREFPQGVRFELLAYPQLAAGNISVRVNDIRRVQNEDGAELVFSLHLARDGGDESKISLPVHFEIEGARSELTVEMEGSRYDLKEHRIPLETTRERGWGKVSIPADANPADNDFYFAFEKPVPRRAIVIADDERAIRPLQLSAAISPDPTLECKAEVVDLEQFAGVEWEQVSLLLWQGPLPDGSAAGQVKAFVDRGGYVLFFPPATPESEEAFGVRWEAWAESEEGIPVEHWRGDQDLLANTQSGASLPVGQLEVRRYCKLAGETTPLATLKGGAPLLARVATTRGGVYFCTTTPALADSSLATNGVVLYVLVQRALAGGAMALGSTRQLIAGEAAGEGPAGWQRLAGTDDGLSTEYASHRGVYSTDEKLLAVNRSAAEDQAVIVAEKRIAGLFQGLDFTRVDDEAGSFAALVQEIWRVFLGSMIVALIVEAALCMPRPAPVSPAGGGA